MRLNRWMPSDTSKKARYALSFLQKKLVHVNLQLLYSCNFRCEICDFWQGDYATRPRLSIDQVRMIADKLAKVGPQIISIGGGEPLLHPEIEEVVRILAKDHFPVMICNGWYVTPEIAHRLFAAGMYEISVSVDYADAERHDAQRGVKGAFERALEALRVLGENRVRPDQRVHMISVVLDDNLDEIEQLILLSRDLGVTYLVTLYSSQRGEKEERAPTRDVSRHLLDLKRRYPEFVALRSYIGRFSEAIEQGGIGGCQCGRRLCNIDSQGEVSFCIDHAGDSVGNILHDEISVLMERLRARHETNQCTGCWTSCRGSIESALHRENPLGNLWDYYQMTRSHRLLER